MFEFPQRNHPSDKPSQAWNHLVVQNFKTCHILNSPHHRSVTNTYHFKCRFCVVNVVRFQKRLFFGFHSRFFRRFAGMFLFPSCAIVNHFHVVRNKKMQWLRPRLIVRVYIWICVLDYLNKTQVSWSFGAKPPCQDLMKNTKLQT